MLTSRNVYDSISPIDYRYYPPEVARWLSEKGFIEVKLLIEAALVEVLTRRGLCDKSVLAEVMEACRRVTAEEVYKEEDRIHHDIRALVNCIRKRVSAKAKPFIHLTATSYDIIESANALRYRVVVGKILVPELIRLERILVATTLREADTVHIARTHGQHALPITFGFALAEYVSRLGDAIQHVQMASDQLVGKFSGAVGGYHASSLLFSDPELFEREVLQEVGIVPAEYATQIVPPERLTRLITEVILVAGILANLADDMRHLQRTEIGEVGELFQDDQVGSSTMPHKKNPIAFENVKSLWKVVMPRIVTVLMDQISEHQRDLTNSASARTYGEIIAYVMAMAKRLSKIMKTLRVDKEQMRENIAIQNDFVLAEPLYIVLAALGYAHAHEKVLALTKTAKKSDMSLIACAYADTELASYFEKMTDQQRALFDHPETYVGRAPEQARKVALHWQSVFKTE